MKNQLSYLPAVLLMLMSMNVFAQDWPQFLGPERNSTSPQKNLLREWPETGPEVLWTVPLGIGYGGPVVKDGKVYILDRNDEEGDKMRCFDLNTGDELWNFEYAAAGSVMFPGSRSVPIVDDKHVYSCGPFGDLYCIDLESHKPVWNVNVWTEFGGDVGNPPSHESEGGAGGFAPRGNFPIWAISQNPLIYDDLLVLASQAPDAGVVAYNKNTGNLVWKTPNLGNENYASPTVIEIHGEDHIVMVISSTNPIGRRDTPKTPGSIVGIDPANGKILWKFEGWECHITVPSAVDVGNNKILATGGYERGATMIQVEKQSDGSYAAKELFTTVEFGDQTKPPLLIDGNFYAQYGTNNRRDGLTCMNMNGEIMWKTKRDPDFNKGSMIYADGLILATDGARKLYLIEPDISGFKPIASSELLAEQKGEGMVARFGTQNWAPIALADGKLLIRDQSRMLCVQVAESY
ncbi:PQQ-binding-like beta-propeller repeat protein [Gaoshiqia sediminis]|uniref:PQQ-binding-like beta-propeller repeat protein n=1 Tax=Gaoshiqia sediminis TaxID=2986998 RepID=A0AA41Y5J8_9BACT|nr:PQQ-binding-like beta-propeller repeat protein [Gaoshiqia sediminis]MCW0483824.1 PQQ-binding-like beta-propeller repeat protein [Gaoshiqia sediminis]